MEKNCLNKLIETSKTNGRYFVLMENINILMSERIMLVGNYMRNLLGLPEKEINRELIYESVKKINDISKELGEEFYIEENWEKIEFFLKSTILEDISKEFKRQVA